MRRRLVIGIAAVGLLAAACSDDDNGPSIDSFDVPSSADCSGGETGTVEVSWDTTAATEVILLVDGAEIVAGADPSGNETLDLPCDGEDHNIGLTALGDDSKASSDTKSVSTETDGGDGGSGGTTTPGGAGGGTTTPGGGTTPTTGATTTTAATTPTTTGGTAPPLPTNVPAPDPGPAAP